jgi:hypothetical protein
MRTVRDMKVLVCGGRFYGKEPNWGEVPVHARERAQREATHIRSVLSAFHAGQPIARLIEGGADGADEIARLWAREERVVNITYKAEWGRHGKAAGPIRNERMLEEERPDVVIAFPGGAGTAHMVKIARAAGVEVLVIAEQPDKPNGVQT